MWARGRREGSGGASWGPYRTWTGSAGGSLVGTYAPTNCTDVVRFCNSCLWGDNLRQSPSCPWCSHTASLGRSHFGAVLPPQRSPVHCPLSLAPSPPDIGLILSIRQLSRLERISFVDCPGIDTRTLAALLACCPGLEHIELQVGYHWPPTCTPPVSAKPL